MKISLLSKFTYHEVIKNIGCLTKLDYVVNLVNIFNECVYFSHGVQRDHILCYFDKETGFGSVDLSVFGTGICKNAVVEHYKLVFDCV